MRASLPQRKPKTKPDPGEAQTNLTVRMQLRRFTRLTNAHSKSLDHHKAMQAIFFCWYNWYRKHETIKTTPVAVSGLTDHAWTIRELLKAAA